MPLSYVEGIHGESQSDFGLEDGPVPNRMFSSRSSFTSRYSSNSRRSSRRLSRRLSRRSLARATGSRLWEVLRLAVPSKYENKTADEIQKKMRSDPDGNLYRGWAVGTHSGVWQFFLTCLVIFIQLFAPVAMVYWLWEKASRGHFELFWHSERITHSGKFTTIIFQKLLGLGFLSLIFVNGENILERSDLQTDKLRTLFTLPGAHVSSAKAPWMFVDSFVNSWCIVFCALAVGPLLWTSDGGIHDVILDSFGLFFLHNLDEYSGDVEYGIETSDFDDMIEEKAYERKAYERGKALTSPQEEEDRLRSTWVRGCLRYGDVWFSVGRVLNGITACLIIPAYLTLTWHDDEGGIHENVFGPWGWPQLLGSALLYGVVLARRVYDLLAHPEDEPVILDCLGISIFVFVGRHDPRRNPDEFSKGQSGLQAREVPLASLG